jgi:hypothetical protein
MSPVRCTEGEITLKQDIDAKNVEVLTISFGGEKYVACSAIDKASLKRQLAFWTTYGSEPAGKSMK